MCRERPLGEESLVGLEKGEGGQQSLVGGGSCSLGVLPPPPGQESQDLQGLNTGPHL